MNRPTRTVRVGAIDVGTNSIRLLVADVPLDGGSPDLVTLARAGESCRLGRGLERTGRIEPEIAARAADLVAEFVARARALGVESLRIGATAALRSAVNGAEIGASIAARSGVPVHILTGDEEAQLVYESVVLGLGSVARSSACIVFDLGGGSTEVVSGVGERAGRWASLAFGAVSLTERHLGSGPPTPAGIEALERQVRADLDAGCAAMPESTPLLAGVGGTVTVLAALDRGLDTYEPSRIEGWTIDRERLEALIERVLRSSETERRTWAVMGRGRSDIVVAGVLVVRLMAERFRARGLVCSTQGLRYGLARQAAKVQQEARDPGHLGG